jgi:hypothetical protein
MANVIEFPKRAEHEWRGIEADLREAYKAMPDGPGCIDECMPLVRTYFDTLFPAFSVNLEVPTTGDVTEEVKAAILKSANDAVAQVVAQLRKERATSLATLAAVEYKAAYYRRNPSAA